MPENNKENIEQAENVQTTDKSDVGELDAASRSLAEALRVSFVILKIIMFLLVVIFLASGFFTVGPEEQGLVLRFGKIRGIGPEKLLGPGLHWSFPYPIDEIITIPVKKVQTLVIDSFWYHQSELEKLDTGPKKKRFVPRTLNPIRDGYCLTRNEKIAGVSGNDYNIVHSKWQLNYLIDNAELFFKNVDVDEPAPGKRFSDVIAESIAPLLKSLAADVIVTTMVNFSIDEAIVGKAEISAGAARLLQNKLDRIGCGIKVDSMQITQIEWPRQVDNAFLRSIKASQENQKLISQAKGYADNILNEVGGGGVYEILDALNDSDVNELQMELLWSRLAGSAQETIAQARAYRTKVVESAKADAEYLQTLLPEYKKRPELVLQKIYQDAIEFVLDNVDEKIIVQPSPGGKSREIRIELNKDPAAKPKHSGDQKLF